MKQHRKDILIVIILNNIAIKNHLHMKKQLLKIILIQNKNKLFNHWVVLCPLSTNIKMLFWGTIIEQPTYMGKVWKSQVETCDHDSILLIAIAEFYWEFMSFEFKDLLGFWKWTHSTFLEIYWDSGNAHILLFAYSN